MKATIRFAIASIVVLVGAMVLVTNYNEFFRRLDPIGADNGRVALLWLGIMALYYCIDSGIVWLVKGTRQRR
jgi:hypothetical protein